MQHSLLSISENLDKWNVSAMKFLCKDHIVTQEITDAKQLFLCLQESDIITEGNLSFLKELLYIIHRVDLLKELGTTKEQMELSLQSSTSISSYRALLYNISEDLSKSEVDNVKFLLKMKLPKNKMEEATMLDILLELEKAGHLSKDNLEKLKNILTLIRKDLLQKVKAYENQRSEAPHLESTFEKMSVEEKAQHSTNCAAKDSPLNKQQNESLPATHAEIYKMEKKPHGWLVIMNNYNFEEARSRNVQLNDRKGTEKDAEAITDVFKARGYVIKEHKDLTGDNILEIMEKYRKLDHTERDSFVCFVLSHGDVGTVYGTDGAQVAIKKLTDPFNGQNCKSLVNKPKVFFIQACRGQDMQPPVYYHIGDNAAGYTSDAAEGHLPIMADFLTAFATVEDYTSLRHEKSGTIYIQQLCQTLESPQFHNTELLTILTHVNNKIAEMKLQISGGTQRDCTQMPSFKSELRKALILPPPTQVVFNQGS
ncbi:caspase-8-like [Ascaphus truei]|uniref:caspase-8-like n=1 Tax=Ascaphus truei TaxID=8439 RepID=UPI003F591E56